MKYLLAVLYSSLVIIMAAATLIEKYHGTPFVSQHIYHTVWFALLWAALATVSVVQMVRSKQKSAILWLLHSSFLVILSGACITRFFARQGTVSLPKGKAVSTFERTDTHTRECRDTLPFAVQLNHFEVTYHPGTDTPADYASHITFIDGDKHEQQTVSMNRIATYKGVRFYQTAYDEATRTTLLTLNADPIGIAVTYLGYALLFFSLTAMLFRRNGTFRQMLRHPLLQKGLFVLLALFAAVPLQRVQASNVLPKDVADKFGHLILHYNNRLCPLQTYAYDFTKKVYGSPRYKDLTPEQVLTGWIFWGESWSNEPFITLPKSTLRDALFLKKHAALNDFFNQGQSGYLLGPYLQAFNATRKDDLHRQIADADEKITLIMNLRRGTSLQLFPVTEGAKTTWYSPTDNLPEAIPQPDRHALSQVFNLLYEYALAGNWTAMNAVLDRLMRYQATHAAGVLPTDTQLTAERIYNVVPFATLLFMLNLGFALVALAHLVARIMGFCERGAGRRLHRVLRVAEPAVLFGSFAALTFCEILRWIVARKIPLSNGYETMLLIAWLVMLLSLATFRRFGIMLLFGYLLSGFFLLVSHISQMDPQITPAMPVLNSPLLTIHVSIIMLSYALLSFTFVCALLSFALEALRRVRPATAVGQRIEALRSLSLLCLYPALATLGIGIFVGAIWANISWGRYWSWDPKETWALITFMVYAVAAHPRSIGMFKRPLAYHLYLLLAFATVLMTYFGVNYFLGGMHSYA